MLLAIIMGFVVAKIGYHLGFVMSAAEVRIEEGEVRGWKAGLCERPLQLRLLRVLRRLRHLLPLLLSQCRRRLTCALPSSALHGLAVWPPQKYLPAEFNVV